MVGRFSKLIVGLGGLLLVLICIISCTSCNKDDGFASREVILVFPIDASPNDSIFQIGDTIWISANINADSIMDYNTETYLDLKKINFYKTFNLFELVYKDKFIAEQPGASLKFDYINRKGGLTNLFDTFNDFEFDSTANRYILSFAIIPKEVGIYCFNFLGPGRDWNIDEIVDLGVDAAGTKITPIFEGMYFPINNGQLNFNLLIAHCKSASLIHPESKSEVNFEQKGTFTFRIIE